MSYQTLTPNQIKVIQKRIHLASRVNTQLLEYFRQHKGLIKDVGEGIINHTTTKWENMKPGQISRGTQDLPDSHPLASEINATLIDLATKVVIPFTQRDAWANNKLVGEGDLIQQAVNNQLKSLMNQVDQFLAQGDAMKNPLGGDKAAGEGVFTGLFNGFTNLGAGDGQDNNMNAKGDYISDFASRTTALKNAGFEKPKYFIMSDVDTWEDAQSGNHLYTTNTITTEMDAVMARKDVQDWINSVNFQNSSSQSQILVTTPYNSFGFPNYRLLQGYNFRVKPLYNGGLGPTGNYELIVIWSGCIEELEPLSVQRSGTLVFTAP